MEFKEWKEYMLNNMDKTNLLINSIKEVENKIKEDKVKNDKNK